MANTWGTSDIQLQRQMQEWYAWLLDQFAWEMRLFKNNFSPGPGVVIGDLTEADFPGYTQIVIDNTLWETPVLVANVVETVQPLPCEFVADPTGFSSQIIYGYYVVDDNGDLAWAERFTNEREIFPDDVLRVTAKYRHANLPW